MLTVQELADNLNETPVGTLSLPVDTIEQRFEFISKLFDAMNAKEEITWREFKRTLFLRDDNLRNFKLWKNLGYNPFENESDLDDLIGKYEALVLNHSVETPTVEFPKPVEYKG